MKTHLHSSTHKSEYGGLTGCLICVVLLLSCVGIVMVGFSLTGGYGLAVAVAYIFLFGIPITLASLLLKWSWKRDDRRTQDLRLASDREVRERQVASEREEGERRTALEREERERHAQWIERAEERRAEHRERIRKKIFAMDLSSFDRLSGSDFEDVLSNLFTRLGYTVEKTGRAGDQGVDLLLTQGSHRVAVQAKRWSGPVNNKAVQEVYAGMARYRAHEGWVVTPSRFLPSATELAKTTGVRLIGREELAELLQRVSDKASPAAIATGQSRPVNSNIRRFCPACGAPSQGSHFCVNCDYPLSKLAASRRDQREVADLISTLESVYPSWLRAWELALESELEQDAARAGQLYRQSMEIEQSLEPQVRSLGGIDPTFRIYEPELPDEAVEYFSVWYGDLLKSEGQPQIRYPAQRRGRSQEPWQNPSTAEDDVGGHMIRNSTVGAASQTIQISIKGISGITTMMRARKAVEGLASIQDVESRYASHGTLYFSVRSQDTADALARMLTHLPDFDLKLVRVAEHSIELEM